jgi:hypothetical protein
MLIKFDLSKYFDRISWQYMCSLLEAIVLDTIWIAWIMQLTSSAFFSILFNGVPSQPSSPTKGIRQGEPLSPFLFGIMDEGLGRYINASVEDGSLKGLSLHNLQPKSYHSQFVDDTFMMNTPTAQEDKKLKNILTKFSEALGTCWINEREGESIIA